MTQRLVIAVTLFGLVAACGAPPPAGGPVVLIVVDTLRADHLGAYGYRRPTSPALDAWASEGRLYERAWSTSSWTLPSFGSILTGRLPSAHGAVALVPLPAAKPQFGQLAGSVPTLAQRFGAAGYATAAFVTNPYLAPLLGLDRGFEVYDHAQANKGTERRADRMVDRALAWIDAQDGEPFFLLLHLMDPHVSYEAPEPHRKRFTAEVPGSGLRQVVRIRDLWALRAGRRPAKAGGGRLTPEDRRFVAAAYDEEVAFVDAEMGRLRAGLEERGVLKRGVVAFSADHGEELFEHGGFEHGHSLFDEVVRVPLVFWGAGVRPGRERAPVSLVDVAPTLVEAAGLTLERPVEGISLWPNLSRGEPLPQRTLHFEDVLYGAEKRGALRWPWKVVVTGEGQVGYWNLDRDPGELGSSDDPPPPAVARLLEELGAAASAAGSRPAELDAETLGGLKALGYLEE